MLSAEENAPAARPTAAAPRSPGHPTAPCAGTGKSGPEPSSSGRSAAATALASATGTRLRGFHSNRRSSTARRTAAIGDANVADIPAAAPATSSVFLSAAERWNRWAMIEPKAPPVMMIGPSAPKGPPDPIEIAEESGLRIATFGEMRLLPNRIASSASGMPWPRIFSDPKRAMRPTTSPPTTGTTIIHGPNGLPAGPRGVSDSRP